MPTPTTVNISGLYKQSFSPTIRGDFPSSAASYTSQKEMSFESGTLGNEADGTSGMVDAWRDMIYTSDQASQGTKSAELHYPIGAEGFGLCGSENVIPGIDEVDYGEELWIRYEHYMPSASSVYSDAGFLKTLRCNVFHPVGVLEGAIDLLEESDGTFTVGNEVAAVPTGIAVDNSFQRTYDAWHTFEFNIKLHMTEGHIRFWLDGALAYEELNIETANQVDAYCNLYRFGSNWNYGAPVTLSGRTGTFVVGETLSSDNAFGTAGASFADVWNIHTPDIFQIVPVGTSLGQADGYGLAAGDTITGLTSGATGVLVRTQETSYFDNVIVATTKKGIPIRRDSANNPYIGTVQVAV